MKNTNDIIKTKHLCTTIKWVWGLLIILLLGFICINKWNDWIIIDKCENTEERIEKIKTNIEKSENEIDQNIFHIYNRVCEISKENPDEVRDKVIKSIDMKNNDRITRKASVLALLNNYEELNNDFQVQVYMNENLQLMLKIEKDTIILDNYIEILKQCKNELHIKLQTKEE